MINTRHLGRSFVVVLIAIIMMVLSVAGTVMTVNATPRDIYFTEDFNPERYSFMDFSSKRLLVMTDDEDVIADSDVVISALDGVYLLQFEDEESTVKAYAYYADKADAVSPDEAVCICDELANNELPERAGDETVMTEEENPIAELAKIEEEKEDAVVTEEYDIALIDTGASEENVAKAVSVLGGSPEDGNGHGTYMSELIRQQNPDARILSIKAIGDDGYGDISAIYAAIELADSYDVRFINLSVSAFSSDTNSVLKEIVKRVEEAGITVVGSAGNKGVNVKYFVPGNIDEAIICGSCEGNGIRIESSNYGKSVDYNVVSLSTSEAAAIMTGILSKGPDCETALQSGLEEGLIFENDFMDYSPDGQEYTCDSDFFEITDQGTFWADPNFGEADLLYYGSINGVTLPAYCIDHGLSVPTGTYGSRTDMNNQLGYVMRNGYPNTNWGLSWHEAQYLTQCAVFGIVGVPLYDICDGMMPCSWIYDQLWGAGHFYIAENLIAAARSNASSEDAAYATFWNPNNGYSQRVVTPTLSGNLTLTKTTAASGACNAQLLGNAMYSQDFSGAKFTVKVKHKNSSTWTSKAYSTGTNGKFTVSDLIVGDVVEVTEAKAPSGYLISSPATKSITIVQGSNSVSFEDPPAFATPEVLACKVRYENGTLIESAPVKDAVYKVEYFDNTSCSGTAKRTWYFMTDSKGEFRYRKEDLATGFTSDDLFVDMAGGFALPLGSIKMTEEKAPAGFLKSKDSFIGTITRKSASAEFSWQGKMPVQNQLMATGDNEITTDGNVNDRGAILLGERELIIAIDKIDSGTEKSVSGAVLQLLQGNNVLKEWTTDGSVMEIRNILVAGQVYKIHEKTAPNDYKTASDIEFVFDENGAITVITPDIGQFVSEHGYVGLKMEDKKKIVLPLTGSSDGMWMTIIGVLVIFGGVMCYRKRWMGIKQGCKSCRKESGKKGLRGKAAVIGGLTLISVLTISLPVMAQGKIEVIGKNDYPITYKAYLLLEGEYEDGALWGITTAPNIPEEIRKMIDEDKAGSNVDKLADAVLKNKNISPTYTFKSDEVIDVRDGYYLVVSDETYPMLIMAGGGETQSIYEKLIPKDEPKTGDENNVILYSGCVAAGLLVIITGLWLIMKNGRNKE